MARCCVCPPVRVTAGVLVLNMLQPILLVLAAALILSGVLAGRLARRITEPLNRLDLEHPLENDTYEELAPLLRRMEHQRRQIDRQMGELRQRSEEFDQITGSMNEGLVLLDETGAILSINPAARRLLDADGDCVGQDFLTVDRDVTMSDALRQAAEQGHSEFRGERNGREYQFDVTRIQTEGRTAGTVLLVFDVTERAFAERNRREFTANVSHELKTPLQGIIGSAELLENGMVKQEDVPRFVGHIRAEAQRLVTLIGDIIRLSQLDEGEPMPTEPVELLAVAREVAENLRSAAEARNVTVEVTGTPATVSGVQAAAVRDCAQPVRQRHQVQHRGRPRGGGGGAGRRHRRRHGARTPASVSRRSTRAACSSGSTGWTRATPRHQAARGWACPS